MHVLVAPQLERAVLGAACNALAICAPVDCEHLVCVSGEVDFELPEGLAARLHIPQLDGRILGRRDEQPRIGLPRDLVHSADVTAQGCEILTSDTVPDADGLVETCVSELKAEGYLQGH